MSSKTVNGKKHLCENMSLITREAFTRMRTNTIIALPQNNNCKIVGITSAQPGEGKSTTTINLAYSFAELDKKVLLIDADMRRPSIGKRLSLKEEIGFSDLLKDTNEVSSAILQYISKDGNALFDVICSKAVENAGVLLSAPRFPVLLEALAKEYDYIFIDLPPIGAVIDAVLAGKHADGIIVIARENETPQRQFDYCIKQLEFAGIKILGIVFNGSLEGAKKYHRYDYY